MMMKFIRESLVSLKLKCVKKQNDQSESRSNEIVKCDDCIEEESDQCCKCRHNIILTEEAIRTVDDDANKANSSFAHAVINMVGMLIGLGQLSAPYAMEKGGWLCSLTFLTFLATSCCYTCHLLGQCLHHNPKLQSYVDIASHAFGRRGRLIAFTFIYFEIFMALVSYTISLHDNLLTVLQQHFHHLPRNIMLLSSSQTLTLLAVLVAMPSLWLRDFSSISFMSSAGILMSVVIFLAVAFTPVFGDVRVDRDVPVLRMRNVASVSGIYIYGYSGHTVFPDLCKTMKDPSKFTKASIVSFSLVTLLYTTLGFLGAKMFGPQVKSQIALSLPPTSAITKIALWATVLTPMTKYALEFAPIALHLQHRLLPSSMSPRTKRIIRGTVGSVLLLVILALALSVPYFEDVLGLTGSLVSVVICFIFPCTFYTKMFWSRISKPVLLLNLFLIAFGVLVGVVGTVSSSRSLLKNLLAAH